jgi:hypothetical protein
MFFQEYEDYLFCQGTTEIVLIDSLLWGRFPLEKNKVGKEKSQKIKCHSAI